MLLAYHKDPTNQACGFVSNNQVAADRRGGPRPRRRRHSPSDKKEASTGASSSNQHPEPAQAGGVGSASSCSAAGAEPMYVEPPTDLGAYGCGHDTPTVLLAPPADYSGPGWSPGKHASSNAQGSSAWSTRPSHGTSDQHVHFNNQEDDLGPQGLNPDKDKKAPPAAKREASRGERDCGARGRHPHREPDVCIWPPPQHAPGPMLPAFQPNPYPQQQYLQPYGPSCPACPPADVYQWYIPSIYLPPQNGAMQGHPNRHLPHPSNSESTPPSGSEALQYHYV